MTRVLAGKTVTSCRRARPGCRRDPARRRPAGPGWPPPPNSPPSMPPRSGPPPCWDLRWPPPRRPPSMPPMSRPPPPCCWPPPPQPAEHAADVEATATAVGRGSVLGQEAHDHRGKHGQRLLDQAAEVEPLRGCTVELRGKDRLVFTQDVVNDLLSIVGVHRLDVDPALNQRGIVLGDGGLQGFGALRGGGIVLHAGHQGGQSGGDGGAGGIGRRRASRRSGPAATGPAVG